MELRKRKGTRASQSLTEYFTRQSMGENNSAQTDRRKMMNENETLRGEIEEMRKRLEYFEQQYQGTSKTKSSTSKFSKTDEKDIDLKGKIGSVEKQLGKSKYGAENESKDIEAPQEIASLLKDGDEGDGIHIKKKTQEDFADEDGLKDFGGMVMERAGWLVGLLILQSLSSFIIQHNEALLQRHPVIVRFLTMLVGAGGNAGNQASVRVIRGLAVGTIRGGKVVSFLINEYTVGLFLSVILGIAGWLRAAVFLTPLLETIAITTSLFMIVMISVLLGASLPLGMKMLGIDPAHSSTTIQVLMDILGVTITIIVSSLILDSGLTSSELESAESDLLLRCSCIAQDSTEFQMPLCPDFRLSNETQCLTAL